MVKSKTKTSVDRILGLVQQVALEDLRLATCRCRFAPQPSPPPTDLAQKINVQTALVENNGAHLVCLITLTIADVPAGLDPKNDSPPEGGTILMIDAGFQITYGLKSAEGVTHEQMQDFGQINALHNVWPYWREFVQTMTGRMGLPALKIPLMRPGDLNFTKDEEVTLPTADKAAVKGQGQRKKRNR
jgi:hypothetical protein